MFEFIKRQSHFTRIEFWGFTTMFVFLLFFFVADSLDGMSALRNPPYKELFEKANVPYSYYRNYFLPVLIQHFVVFGGFLFLNFLVIPAIMRKEALWKNILFATGTFILSWIIFSILNTYIHAYEYGTGEVDKTEQGIFRDTLEYTFALFLLLFVYSAIKYSAIYLLSKTEGISRRYPYIRRETIVATMIWLVILIMVWLGGADIEFSLTWTILVPYAIAFYSLAFYRLIPRSLTQKNPRLAYGGKSIVFIAALFFPVLAFLLVSTTESNAFSISFFNNVFQLFVTVPVTWLLYRRYQKKNEEMNVLQTELKQSTASIDFLRSQINPHFLFNALNTLYGTAIQENADRTSEGIQKLGDMMRFMLRENMQEKISLSREIDYLENYISLQRLRTDTNPMVQIQTTIENQENRFSIAPMLLIPFVENAFKHGISFREPSHIKVTLEIRDNILNFDVYNSKHIRNHNDPEKDKSGIGLENVRQRLLLLYPDQHELSIRDTTREFFIHLTIQLA